MPRLLIVSTSDVVRVNGLPVTKWQPAWVCMSIEALFGRAAALHVNPSDARHRAWLERAMRELPEDVTVISAN